MKLANARKATGVGRQYLFGETPREPQDGYPIAPDSNIPALHRTARSIVNPQHRSSA